MFRRYQKLMFGLCVLAAILYGKSSATEKPTWPGLQPTWRDNAFVQKAYAKLPFLETVFGPPRHPPITVFAF